MTNVFPRHLAALVALLGSIFLSSLRAQTTAISNVGQGLVNANNAGVGKQTVGGPFDFSQAFSFTTGSTAVGFSGINLPLVSSGVVTGFTVSLHTGINSSGPTGFVLTLNGSSAPTTGINNYFPGTATTLLANTTYWLVAAAPTTAADTTLGINYTASTSEDAGGLAGWSIADTHAFTNNGGQFWSVGATNALQFSVLVTAIPEPSTYALLAGCVGLTMTVFLRRKANRPTRSPGLDSCSD